MKSIYDISKEIKDIYEKLANGEGINKETGEIDQELQMALSISRGELETKAVDYGYVIKSKDESIAYYPRHKLVKDSSGPFAETLDGGKRGIIKEILEYYPKTDKYKVIYTDNSVDTIKAKNLRETNPTSLGILERSYWSKNKGNIPSNIAAYA